MPEKKSAMPEQQRQEKIKERLINEKKVKDGTIIRRFADENNRKTKTEIIFPNNSSMEILFDKTGEIIRTIDKEKISENKISESHFDAEQNPIEVFIKDMYDNILEYKNFEALENNEKKIIAFLDTLRIMGIKKPEDTTAKIAKFINMLDKVM